MYLSLGIRKRIVEKKLIDWVFKIEAAIENDSEAVDNVEKEAGWDYQ